METTTETGLIPVQEFSNLIMAAPKALEINNEIVTKAIAAGEGLLQKIEAEGMTDEMDAKCNQFIVKIEERLREMYDRRTPLTRMFDDIKSKYTELENKVSRKKADTIPAKIQAKRDEYARYKVEEQKKRDLDIKRKQDIETAKINMLSEAKIDLTRQFESFVEKAKRTLLSYFDGITIENAEHQEAMILSFGEGYAIETFNDISIDINSSLLKWEELLAIKEEAKTGMFEQFAYQYKSRISEHKQYLKGQVPGKIQYLKDLANANADKKAKMEAEEKSRKEAEEVRLTEERLKAEADANARIEADKQHAATDALFNNTVEVLDNTESSNAIESYEINVLKPAGYVLLFQKWFEKEGITKDNSVIEKKSIGQMKAFCEKLYKDGEKIESPYLEYVPVYKVRMKK